MPKPIILTAYDRETAELLEQVEVDMILVGDSYGMVVLGHKDTKSVSLDMLIEIAREVRRGAPNSQLIFDMPFATYGNYELALSNVEKVLEAVNVDAFKIEGSPNIARYLVSNGIKVMGHTGLKPQSVSKFIVQGQTVASANQIKQEAKALEAAGCFAIVLECIAEDLAEEITRTVKIPTIGIGSGQRTTGQVRVTHDIMAWPGGKKFSYIEKQYNDPFKSNLENLQDFMKKIRVI